MRDESNVTKLLVIAEHDDGQLKLATMAAVDCAKKICAAASGQFEILVLGESIGAVASTLASYGAASVLTADHAALKHPVADKYAQVIAAQAKERGATMVIAAA